MLLLVAGTGAHAQTSDPGAPRVALVRVVEESGDVLEQNPAGLPLQPGAAYEAAAVRDALRWLYATGRYADVTAEMAETAAGVQLDFVVRRNFFVNQVRVIGLQAPPAENWALAALRLALGTTFREDDLVEALDRLRQTMADEGLFQAQIERELTPHEATRQMDITLRVEPGPRARVGAILLDNQTPYPDAELLRRSKLQPKHTS